MIRSALLRKVEAPRCLDIGSYEQPYTLQGCEHDPNKHRSGERPQRRVASNRSRNGRHERFLSTTLLWDSGQLMRSKQFVAVKNTNPGSSVCYLWPGRNPLESAIRIYAGQRFGSVFTIPRVTRRPQSRRLALFDLDWQRRRPLTRPTQPRRMKKVHLAGNHKGQRGSSLDTQ